MKYTLYCLWHQKLYNYWAALQSLKPNSIICTDRTIPWQNICSYYPTNKRGLCNSITEKNMSRVRSKILQWSGLLPTGKANVFPKRKHLALQDLRGIRNIRVWAMWQNEHRITSCTTWMSPAKHTTHRMCVCVCIHIAHKSIYREACVYNA